MLCQDTAQQCGAAEVRTAAARLLVRGTGCGYSLQNFKHGIYLVDAASPNVGDGIFWSKEQSCQEQLEVLWLCLFWLSWFMSENISLHMCSLFLNERVICLCKLLHMHLLSLLVEAQYLWEFAASASNLFEICQQIWKFQGQRKARLPGSWADSPVLWMIFP